MRVELLTTGSELLLGQVLNTHTTWLGQKLFPLGLRLAWQSTVPDGPPIAQAVQASVLRGTEILLITGGLGPTGDDLTRECCAEICGLPLEENAGVLAAMRERLGRRSIEVRANMLRQALVPCGAEVLPNHHGTAPGLYFPPALTASCGGPPAHWFLLPGPPRELHPMVLEEVLPRLSALIPRAARHQQRLYRVCGMGESAVEERIGRRIQDEGIIEVGYCARPNEVDLRLIGPGDALQRWDGLVREELGKHLFAEGDISMEERIVALLTERRATVATAESCTGGLLASRLTDVPGSSGVFQAGYVVYSNEAKERELGVPADLLRDHGAVSAAVAGALARGARRAAGTTWALSTTGIAGPGGASPGKPVGTVFFGLAGPGDGVKTWGACYPMERSAFKLTATQTALNALRQALESDP